MGELAFCKLISHAAAAEFVGAIGEFLFHVELLRRKVIRPS